MTQEKPNPKTEPDMTQDPNQDTQNPEQGADQEAADEQKIKELEAKVSELQQKVLLAAAEYQNVVRRAQVSIGEAREQQTMDIAKSLLKVIDLFEMALKCDPQKVSAESILVGVQMVHGELLKTLEGFDIQRINANPGDPFDHNVHEAIAQVQSDNVQSRHVAAQLQPGYRIGSKVLRPAKVNVAE